MYKYIPVLNWLASIFFCLSVISYIITEIPVEACWLMLVAIFLLLVPNEIRKQPWQKRG